MGRERRRLLVANWKMHFVRAQALEYLKVFTERVQGISNTEIVLAPPFTLLETVRREIQGTAIKLAAQDLFYERKGAFTGEISAIMLKDLGCAYVIVGHSERRRLFGETDELISKKLRAALDAEITPILCVGETLEERRAGRTQRVLETQIRGALAGLALSENLVIAYEPVWAIGTGVNAEPEEAEASALFIRELVAQLFDTEIAQKIRILYGGSVKPANFEGFVRQPNIDGALVGGASLDPEAFAQMVKIAECC
ncbi:MAG: triose-phosphate isomerase [Candidatus Bipolaricaulota bacterium]|nr:triose-phosphate isomerase [Candidatus Bipolaricaulota bacterium]MDW8030751.1 triose-phosphate isomerase [Candidatus Bipolaricaulota bacterium]